MLTEQSNKIRFYRWNNYGNEQFYALDMKDAISGLTGRKTLIDRDFKCLKELGFTFEEVLKPNNS